MMFPNRITYKLNFQLEDLIDWFTSYKVHHVTTVFQIFVNFLTFELTDELEHMKYNDLVV